MRIFMTEEEYYIKKYEINEWSNCHADPVYFNNNYVVRSTPLGQRKLQFYPFQEKVIDLYQNNSKIIGNVSRQCGTTYTALSYILWYSMFNTNKTVVIASHSVESAKSMINDFLVSYHLLPDFLKIPFVVKNSQQIKFNNNVQIMALPVSENSGRGMSISLLYVDNAAFCRQNEFKNFLTSVWPAMVVPNGKTIITSTPDTTRSFFYKLWQGAADNGIGNVGSNGFLSYCTKWDDVPGRSADFKSQFMSSFGDDKWQSEFECTFRMV